MFPRRSFPERIYVRQKELTGEVVFLLRSLFIYKFVIQYLPTRHLNISCLHACVQCSIQYTSYIIIARIYVYIYIYLILILLYYRGRV